MTGRKKAVPMTVHSAYIAVSMSKNHMANGY